MNNGCAATADYFNDIILVKLRKLNKVISFKLSFFFNLTLLTNILSVKRIRQRSKNFYFITISY